MTYLNLLLIPLFAALWRCRGGFLGTGSTTTARVIYWALPVALWGYSVEGYVGLFCGVMAFLSLLLEYAPFQADNQLKHCSGMAGIGIARMALVFAPLFRLRPELVYLQYLGALAGAAYYIGWTYLDGFDSGISFPGLTLFGKQLIQPGKFAVGGGEWGEVLTGASAGLVFALVRMGV